jgi:uroporphyrinogen-III synthase
VPPSVEPDDELLIADAPHLRLATRPTRASFPTSKPDEGHRSQPVLFGRTVAVTRAADQAGPLKERLEALGATVIEVPVIAIADPSDDGSALYEAVDILHTYDWVVLTSPNAASRFFRAVTGQQRQHEVPRVAVVGPGTAEVVRQAGGEVDFVPNRSVGEGILETFPARASATRGGRVLLPQAAAARPTVAEGLRLAGWHVDVVEAYRTVAAQLDEDQIAAALTADVVVFTSSSTALRFAEIAGGKLGWPRIVSMGPQTTQTVRESGRHEAATADPHTLDGLISAIIGVLGPQ